MPRYVALLRGVSPQNLKMADLKRCLEAGGFTEVKTLLSSGNVAFNAPKTARASLEKKVEKTLTDGLGKSFLTLIRSQDELTALLESEPFAKFSLKPTDKRVVTFLREDTASKLKLPVEGGGGRILGAKGQEVFTVYTPGTQGAGFMVLLEKTFGKTQTTRTWDTVRKCAAA